MNEITKKNNYIPQLEFIIRTSLFESKIISKQLELLFKNNSAFNNTSIRDIFIKDAYDIIRYWRLWCACTGIDDYLNPNIEIRKVIFSWSVCRNNYYYNEVSDEIKERIFTIYAKFISETQYAESVPDWINELGKKEYGSQWEIILKELNKNPQVHIRVNTLKTTKAELIEKLSKARIKVTEFPESDNALFIESFKNIYSTQEFKDGLFEVQDVSSQQVGLISGVKPGMRVVDACAGAGGKSLHLATLMNNKGKIITLDIHSWKLEELNKRSKRNGVSIIETREITSSKVVKRLYDTSDLVIIDAPCSGSGVWKRNPDSKWKLTQINFERMINLQKELLEKYSLITKAGGSLLYATCSIFKEEGEEQIKNFLQKKSAEWKFILEKRILPGEKNGDGFYMCVLKREE